MEKQDQSANSTQEDSNLKRISSIFSKGLSNSLAAQVAVSLAPFASSRAKESDLPGQINGQKDAYRHILWATLVTKKMHELYPNADSDEINRSVLQALLIHEDSGSLQGQTKDSENMDFRNNILGIANGSDPEIQKLSYDQIAEQTYNKVISTDGTGENSQPLWINKSEYDKYIPSKNPNNKADMPLTLREELEKNYQDMQQQSGQAENPQPNPNDTDPETGKKFKDMKTGEYFAAYQRWQKRRAANDSHANDNGKSTGGAVHVHAHSRDGGKVSVHAYDRKLPQP